MIKKISFTILLSFFLLSVFSQKKDFVLTGMIGKLKDTTIYLYQKSYEGDILLASTKTKNGEFTFKGKIDQAYAVYLCLNKYKRLKFFLSPGFNNILANKKQFNHKFTIGNVKGSRAQDRYEDYIQKLKENNKAKLKIAEALELPEINSDPIKKKKLKEEYTKLSQFRYQYFYKYAKSPVIPFLIYNEYFSKKVDLEYIKKSLVFLRQANPNGFYVNQLEMRLKMTNLLYSTGGKFPNFKGKDLQNIDFNLTTTKGKPVLLYIWKAWRPDFNEKHYKALQEIRKAYPNLKMVNLIRTSSLFKIRDEKTKKIIDWHPKAQPKLNCVEIESIDAQFPFVNYLKHSNIFYLLNKEGKIEYLHEGLNLDQLKTEIKKLM